MPVMNYQPIYEGDKRVYVIPPNLENPMQGKSVRYSRSFIRYVVNHTIGTIPPVIRGLTKNAVFNFQIKGMPTCCGMYHISNIDFSAKDGGELSPESKDEVFNAFHAFLNDHAARNVFQTAVTVDSIAHEYCQKLGWQAIGKPITDHRTGKTIQFYTSHREILVGVNGVQARD